MKLKVLSILSIGLLFFSIIFTGFLYYYSIKGINTLNKENRNVQIEVIPVLICTLIITLILIILIIKKIEIRTNQILKIQSYIIKLESFSFLAGGVAHDFNNYFSSIIGNINIAKSFFDDKDEIYEILDDAERSSVMAAELTKQFLFYSKQDCPIKGLKKINEIIKGAAGFILRGNKVICKYLLPEELWNVEINEIKVCEIITSLVINSSQAMPKGGEIIIKGENVVLKKGNKFHLKPGKYVYISVEDSGSGIPDKNKNKVFNPFFTTKLKSSGLGLSESYSTIHKHKGYIYFESNKNTGTVFHIYLKAYNSY